MALINARVSFLGTPRTLLPSPFTLHPTTYTLHPTPCTLHHTPYTLHPTPYTPHSTPYTPHPTPFTLHPTPYSLHLAPSRLLCRFSPPLASAPFTPHTLHPTPCTPHPTPYTPHRSSSPPTVLTPPTQLASREREFFSANLLVLIPCIIESIWWTGLAPWEFEFSFPSSLLTTFLARSNIFLYYYDQTWTDLHF